MIAPTLLDEIELVRDRDLRNVRVARRWVRDLLGADHPALFDLVQCLTELITNSFQHTDSATVSVSALSAGPVIRAEVVDAGGPGEGPRLCQVGPENDQLLRGRGLHVVQKLTGGRWGSWLDAAGRRTTWCEVGAGSGAEGSAS